MGMDRQQLDRISVASPCRADWATMKGDAQVRHCAQCDKNVYNLSELSLEDIAQLVQSKEGRLCVKFYRRADGTILTDDCPTGLRRVRRRVMMVASLAFAMLAGVFGFAALNSTTAGRTLRGTWIARTDSGRALIDWLYPEPACTMGLMVAPPPPQSQPPPPKAN